MLSHALLRLMLWRCGIKKTKKPRARFIPEVKVEARQFAPAMTNVKDVIIIVEEEDSIDIKSDTSSSEDIQSIKSEVDDDDDDDAIINDDATAEQYVATNEPATNVCHRCDIYFPSGICEYCGQDYN